MPPLAGMPPSVENRPLAYLSTVVGKNKRKQIRAFKRQKWVCIALLFYFSLSSKIPSFFVTVNATFGTFSYFRLLSEVETDMLFLNAEVPLT